jgi:hypothetical protein
MARVVNQRDDEARFYEERANPWLRTMLLNDGATSLRSFQERHPEITYVTYEPRSGHRLAEWLSLALATVDIVVVDSAAPETIVKWIGELTRPKLQTFLFDPDGQLLGDETVPEFAQWYRAVCVTTPLAESIDTSAVSQMITIGPELPMLGQNGHATRHVDATAEQLVDKLILTTDEALLQSTSENSDSEPPS